MADSVSRQAGFVGVRDGNHIELSRQAGFVAVRDTNKLELSRQAAFVATRDGNHIYISRQVAFVGIRPNPVPYPPNMQFRPSAMRLAVEAQPEAILVSRRGGATVLKARIPVTFVIT